jgi:hypothetical protein
MTKIGTHGDLGQVQTAELLRRWSDIMAELRVRGVIRSSNNPVADYAEQIAAEQLGLTLAGNSTSGYDAVDEHGARYQIKARRLITSKTSRQLSTLRNLLDDLFDWLVVVLLDNEFSVQELWKLPVELVRDHATYRRHVNAHILHARGAVLADDRAIRLI